MLVSLLTVSPVLHLKPPKNFFGGVQLTLKRRLNAHRAALDLACTLQ